MVNIDSRVKIYVDSASQCREATDTLDSNLSSPSDSRNSVSYKMWKDKVELQSRRKLSSREKLKANAAQWVGYDPEQYSRPFKGKSRDLKAVITAVKFKQLVLKHSSRKKDLMKEAILANTMRKAEEDLLIRGRQRQLRRAQAVAEARAKQEKSCNASSDLDCNKSSDLESMDDALQSLEYFLSSLSSVKCSQS